MKNNNNENILTHAVFSGCRTLCSKAFYTFAKETEKAVIPETFDPKARWAVKHDNKWDYNTQTVLNSELKDKLDRKYKALTAEEGPVRQQLHLLEESTLTDEDELEIKNSGIEYINTWLKLMHAFYINFLASVTIDEESFEDKYARVHGELVNRTNKTIISDYVEYMKEYEGWDQEDVERFLAGDDPFVEIPGSFSQSYYADLDGLE